MNELDRLFRKTAIESRKIDKMNIKYAELGPVIHGISRMRLIPPYAYNMSRYVRPLVIRRNKL